VCGFEFGGCPHIENSQRCRRRE